MKQPVFVSVRRLTLPKGTDPKAFQTALQKSLSQHLGFAHAPGRTDQKTAHSAQRTADAIFHSSARHLGDD